MTKNIDLHNDDVSLLSFLEKLRAKMHFSRTVKKRDNWRKLTPEQITLMLREHVEKGDPVDVANFCMMLSEMNANITQNKNEEKLTPVGNGVFSDGSGAIETGEMIGFVGLGYELKFDGDTRERHPVVRLDEAVKILTDYENKAKSIQNELIEMNKKIQDYFLLKESYDHIFNSDDGLSFDEKKEKYKSINDDLYRAEVQITTRDHKANSMITIYGKKYMKFIHYPNLVTDGTLRCIRCGQIDEMEYHDEKICSESM